MRDLDSISRVAWRLLLASLLLAGCTAQIPQNIRQAPPNNPTIADVRNRVIKNQIWLVRWGGKILETENLENETRFTVLASSLNRSGEPEITDNSEGRFIAIVPEFLDPKVYAAGRYLTVSGTVLRFEDRKVGEFAYRYPGINRVLQTAGRVIRSESDRGIVCLVDRRFAEPSYRALLPEEWRVRQTATRQELSSAIDAFWREG